MAQPQQYGSIREFLDNLPHQPCIWQPENQNICVTCLRINEPVARICSVWSQALDNAPLEELDFEEEMRSLPAVEKVAETPASPGLVGIDVIDGEDAEYSVVEAVAAEPAVSESSIAVVDIEPVVAEELKSLYKLAGFANRAGPYLNCLPLEKHKSRNCYRKAEDCAVGTRAFFEKEILRLAQRSPCWKHRPIAIRCLE